MVGRLKPGVIGGMGVMAATVWRIDEAVVVVVVDELLELEPRFELVVMRMSRIQSTM